MRSLPCIVWISLLKRGRMKNECSFFTRPFFISTKKNGKKDGAHAESVNALWRAFFISTIPTQSNLMTDQVSMPYDGLFSFLRGPAIPCNDARAGVNALWRAFFISTLRKDFSYREISVKCQCPMTGFFHFYVVRPSFSSLHIRRVSMPYDGLFSFLQNPFHYHRIRGMCVNALWRAFFISTEEKKMKEKIEKMVSMPYDGLFSFLHPQPGPDKNRPDKNVSMPYDGLFSFLRESML